MIHDSLVSVIDISVADLDIQFKICVPDKILRASINPPKELTVVEMNKGYTVGHNDILEYLRSELLNSLRHVRHLRKKVDIWLEQNPQPWFCFKIYDRLEWAAANSLAFFIQNQLKTATSTLEFRQVTRTPMKTITQSGETLKRPHPIEGFLARVTNISGAEYSNFRAFYRIQYFYSSEGILFFTQIFKGTPPSPGNEFMNDNSNREAVRSLLPEIYYKIPFPLDKNDHIPWMNTPEFERYDGEAVEEFERKVQQVIKADAMIDLCNVKEVSALPLNSIVAHHRYFQSFLWYSSPHVIEDEDIIDCGFEIVLLNGSRLKLMAPSRSTRDEWVERLSALVIFWKDIKTKNMVSQIITRHCNLKRLGISEYVDSNVTSETRGLETKISVGNDQLFDTSSMAMATCVLASGYLYLKHKKHANFNQYFVVLTPGYLVIFTLFQRSKVSGMWKKTPYFSHYLTLLLSQCYIYAGESTRQDLVKPSDFTAPGKNDLPRSYSDGWKSSEEDTQRCFTLWFGHKRVLKKGLKVHTDFHKRLGENAVKNPGLATMIRKLGVTGKRVVFLARSRQEREEWVYKILLEMNRFARA